MKILDKSNSKKNLTYMLSIFGLKTGIRTTVSLEEKDQTILVQSRTNNLLVRNLHRSQIARGKSNIYLKEFDNSGVIRLLNWRFHDRLIINPETGKAIYSGLKTKKEYDVSRITAVDKFGQFLVIRNYFEEYQPTEGLLGLEVSFVDETIKTFAVEYLTNELFKSKLGNLDVLRIRYKPKHETNARDVHSKIDFWISPDLGYLPVKIATKSKGMNLSVQLENAS